MPVVSELIRIEDDGTISFGNYELATKSKLQDFEYKGDLYKVKTFHEITKGNQDAQITVQLEDDREYEVFIDGIAVGGMTTNVSGKLVLSVELNEGVRTEIRIAGR